MTSKNSHRTQVAFYIEPAIGAVPIDAAAWVVAEGAGDAGRMLVQELSPEFIRGEVAVANEDMMTRVGEKRQPHHGLPTADGGSMTSRLWGNGGSFVTGDQVAETLLGRLLAHALGGGSRGNHATVTVVTSQTVIEVDDAGDLEVGQIIGLVDLSAGDGLAYPAQILAIAGVQLTLDRVMPFTIVVGDLVHGAEVAYFDQDALTNPANPQYSTLSILIAKGPDVWVAGGAHLALESIAVERGQQPKLAWPILAACGYPPGTAGAVTLPAFVDPIEGIDRDVRAIGRLTNARLAEYGNTTTSIVCPLFSATITTGVPVLANDTVTECSTGSPGRSGYRTEPADTMITLVVELDASYQTKWTAGTLLTISYYQVATVGRAWCVHGRKCFLMDAPRPVLEGTNRYEVTVQLTDDVDAAVDGELAASKIVLARY